VANHDRSFKILTALIFLSGCSSSTDLAPVTALDQPPSYKIAHHTVANSETLYSIAWRYTLDVNYLAEINRISAPFTVYPGQRLELRNSASSSPPNKNRTADSESVIARSRSAPKAPASKVSPVETNAKLAWRWPVQGRVASRFGGAGSLSKGIDIAVEKGQPVFSAETGTVVYAGSALRGYGNLLIIRHNESFLSAYAHNDRLLAAEGEIVKAGQKIAETGSSGTDNNILHFEIRLNGKPVDPLHYLPTR
jgi:lipoprotein NlpD